MLMLLLQAFHSSLFQCLVIITPGCLECKWFTCLFSFLSVALCVSMFADLARIETTVAGAARNYTLSSEGFEMLKTRSSE